MDSKTHRDRKIGHGGKTAGGRRLAARLAAVCGVVAVLALAGCAGLPITEEDPVLDPRKYSSKDQPGSKERETVFGSGGIFSGKKALPSDGGAAGSGIGVNGFLWRASLDTVAFMPLASADPFGGVIITDWYAPPETPNERFKVTVYILDRQLRADAIRVAVFKELRDAAGGWATAPVDKGTAAKLEDSILGRARELRVAGSGS